MKSNFLLFMIIFGACMPNQKEMKVFKTSHPNFNYFGRIDRDGQKGIILISPASSVDFAVKGKTVELLLNAGSGSHNYIVLEINGKYEGRRRILPGKEDTRIILNLPEEENHIGIYKATEAASGEVVFKGILAEALLPGKTEKRITIEFIGNSITCGALADDSLMPCGQGVYHDQHNAYLAYGPRVARMLNTNYILSSVSGIGIYRNWNDEHLKEPIMPEVYENLYLNLDAGRRYVTSPAPDVVSICLGTNDLSDGDGMNPRLPFDADKFTNNYIQFVEMLFKHYPQTKIALLNSPMVSAEKSAVLSACLEKVKEHFEKEHVIQIFTFTLIQPVGCNYHPGIEDHKLMSEELLPFFKDFLIEPVKK
jgi:Carbohydrate esterase 2 N-terminal/GDSL-like Lipase/Acylhydrolase family